MKSENYVECINDVCDPIPSEMFMLMGLGHKDLFEFCKMRIFNTIFSYREFDDCLREIIWPKFLNVTDFRSEKFRRLYWELATATNEELDEKIRDENIVRF